MQQINTFYRYMYAMYCKIFCTLCEQNAVGTNGNNNEKDVDCLRDLFQ